MKFQLLISLLAVTQLSFSQQNELVQFNKERDKISKTGLKVLIAYSATNILYGTIASSKDNAGSSKYFHQMNAIWNGVTMGLLSIGIITSKKEGNASFAASLKKQSNIEQLFLFNAGLDLAYFAGGAYLKERAATSSNNASRLTGYGESIMLQGAVLFLFDGIMYSVHKHHGKALNKLAENVHLTAANGIGVAFDL